MCVCEHATYRLQLRHPLRLLLHERHQQRVQRRFCGSRNGGRPSFIAYTFTALAGAAAIQHRSHQLRWQVNVRLKPAEHTPTRQAEHCSNGASMARANSRVLVGHPQAW